MLSIILGFITGLSGPISAVISKISDLKMAKLAADSNIEKAKIDEQIQEAHDRQSVLVAEAGNRIAAALNASVRLLLTVGPALFLTKVFAWDKVVGSFSGCAGKLQLDMLKKCQTFKTDPLDTNLWWVIIAVIAFYFMYDIAAKSRR